MQGTVKGALTPAFASFSFCGYIGKSSFLFLQTDLGLLFFGDLLCGILIDELITFF